jgi:hypothetical protein
LKLILSDRAAGSREIGIDTSPKARKPFHAAAIYAPPKTAIIVQSNLNQKQFPVKNEPPRLFWQPFLALSLNKKPRDSRSLDWALMTALTVFLYLPILLLAHAASPPEFNGALNYVADTLLYAGAALLLASALPRAPDRAEKT